MSKLTVISPKNMFMEWSAMNGHTIWTFPCFSTPQVSFQLSDIRGIKGFK